LDPVLSMERKEEFIEVFEMRNVGTFYSLALVSKQ